MERATGIEPVSSAWKAEVLPLHNARLTCYGVFHARSEVKYLLNNGEGISMTEPHAVIIGVGDGLSAPLARELMADYSLTLAAQRLSCCPAPSKTIRTARSRTSGEYLFVVFVMMLHPTHELEPLANPARFEQGYSYVRDNTNSALVVRKNCFWKIHSDCPT